MSAMGVPQILRREQRQIVERLFGFGVEDSVLPESREPRRFVHGDHHVTPAVCWNLPDS